MTSLAIRTTDDRTAFQPGEAISIEVQWDLPDEPEVIEVRLVWNTSGKGDTDVGVEQTISLDAPEPFGTRQLELELPAAPYSFSGKLISLVWALELVAKPSDESCRTEITIAPDAREIVLHHAASDEPTDA